MSTDTIAGMISAMTLFQHFFAFEDVEIDYHETVVRYIYKLQQQTEDDGWTIAVTGHSLGGGISTIVGATMGIESMAFSPPGLSRSRLKFGSNIDTDGKADTFEEVFMPTLKRAAKYTTSIIPMHDLVPTADKHFGQVQYTLCAVENPLKCHLLEGTACDLLTKCGDGTEQNNRWHGLSPASKAQLEATCQ